MIVRSNARDPLPLAPGLILSPGVDTGIPDAEWDALSRLAVVQAWVRAKVLTIVGPEPVDEKAPLIAELAGYGIHRSARTSLERLQTLVADARTGHVFPDRYYGGQAGKA